MQSPTTSRVEALEKQIGELKQELTAARKALRHPVKDYELTRPDGSKVTLSALFGDRDELLVVHNMGRSCPYCTLWADGFVGHYRHYNDRCAFALCSADAPEVAGEFAASRGWNFPVVTAAGSAFTSDMGFWNEKDGFWPGVSAFFKAADGTIYRTGWASYGPGDDFCPVWPMFDLLERGPNDWDPKYTY